jgi:hypothetical protein
MNSWLNRDGLMSRPFVQQLGLRNLGPRQLCFALIDPPDYRFVSLKTLLMPTKATTPHVGINVPRLLFSLAGFGDPSTEGARGPEV